MRDGQVIGLTYDNLGRLTARNLPGTEPDATYAYNLAGWMTQAVQGGRTTNMVYNVRGWQTSVAQTSNPTATIAYQYDVAGRRTRLTYPTSGGASLYVQSTYDVVGNVLQLRENNATTGVGVLASHRDHR